jgi:hypothetical protein
MQEFGYAHALDGYRIQDVDRLVQPYECFRVAFTSKAHHMFFIVEVDRCSMCLGAVVFLQVAKVRVTVQYICCIAVAALHNS